MNFVTREVRISGKGNKDRIVEIPEPIWQRLIDYLEHYRGYEPGYLLNPIWNRRKTPGDGDGGISDTLINRRIDAIRRKTENLLGIRIAPHDFRRTFATDMSNAGMEIRELQILLGHASASTTKTYVFDESSEYR